MLTDKTAVIVSLVILGLGSLWVMGTGSENIVTAIVSGLCGIAVGHSLTGKTDVP